MNFKNYFGTKYPIVSMPMNKVSDLTLAMAVRRAGALPSLSIFNYSDVALLEQDLIDYKKEFNDTKLLLSISDKELRMQSVCNLIIQHQIEFVEILQHTPGEGLLIQPSYEEFQSKTQLEKANLELIRNNNVKVFLKTHNTKNIEYIVDGLVLKGQDGAGRGTESLETLFADIKKHSPDLLVIVSGGIGTAEQVKHYLDNGANAVGIGTLLAVSKECKISNETKLKMIESTSNDIKKFNNGAVQNALIFTEIANDTFNHTQGLEQGIAGTSSGHIFAGTGIDHISEIRPVSDIIDDLIKLI
jgi:NAD(P)H-dependent flavin oxidoreductase YrpB (nitropropane dioxygenase family)